MGCGASSFDTPIVKPKPTRINPRLHHRIEELKRRRRSRSLKNVTPSKKELLRHSSSDEEVGESISHSNPLSDELQKSTHSQEDIGSCITSEGSKKPSDKIEDLSVKVNERLMQNVLLKGPFEGNVGDEKVEKVENPTANVEGGVHGDEEEDVSGDDNDDERRIGNNEDVFPGSPSFRIYYIENANDDKIDNENENPQLKETTCNAQNAAQSEVAESLKDSMTMAEKKGRKRRGFAKAMRGRKIMCY